jgi:uncharacterized protein (TIRG00374 family)
MKTKSIQILRFILFLSLGIFLLWYTTASLSKEDLQKVEELVLQAKLLYVIPSIAALLLSHYIRALRWKMMMDELNRKPGILNVFLSVLVGYFLNLVFPRLGEVGKCSLLGRYEKMPVDKLIGTIVAERLIDLVCLIVVILLTVFSQINRVGSYATELFDKLMTKANESYITVILVFFASISIGIFIYKLFKKSKWLKSVQSFLTGIKEGLFSIQKIKRKRLFLTYTFFIWFLYLFSIRIGFYSLTETVDLSWIPSLTILTFGSFAMIATQGGVGAYQLAVQKTLGLYGINEISGLAFGWLLWSVQTFILLIVGPISMLLLFIFNRNKES